ncbi:hypothetical protein [Aquimonas sp.]|jgi:hypothetical protein|uniref:hypothetical protein n=1 Tax=Aquimonas sp. TaxID=1872588 RepID=UPI0037C01D63
MQSIGLRDELAAGWIALDAELLPGPAQAGDPLHLHSAPTGSASTHAHRASLARVSKAAARGIDLRALPATLPQRSDSVRHCVAEIAVHVSRYCWPVNSVANLRKRALAPRHALALREFVLGHEALHRLNEREPLYWVLGTRTRVRRAGAEERACGSAALRWVARPVSSSSRTHVAKQDLTPDLRGRLINLVRG